MKADHQTYQKATTNSLIGLTIQTIMGVILVVYALLAGATAETDAAGVPLRQMTDHAALTVGVFSLLGIFVWGTLAIVFDQHRRAAIEDLESESLDAQSLGSVFEGSDQGLRVAGKRVAAMHKYMVPIVSLSYGLALIIVGVVRFPQAVDIAAQEIFRDGPGLRGAAISIAIGIAFIGFVFGRYIAGMAKQATWAPMRAGATSVVGTALFALLLALGYFVDYVGPDTLLRILQPVVAGALVLLGAEVFVNFLLDLYRPRVTGTLPRAAFESRLLGLLAAPERIASSVGDAINYQLGIDVTDNWFYKLISRSVTMLVALAIIFGWLLTSFTVVDTHQRAMRIRMGQLVSADVGPGLHMKLPWPFERIEVPVFENVDTEGRVVSREFTTEGIRVLHLGTPPATMDDDRPNLPILWTNDHTTEERFNLVQPTAIGGSAEDGLTQDPVLVAAEVPVYYRVADVEKFDNLAAPGEREMLLTVVGQRALNGFLGTQAIDEVLSTRRDTIDDEFRELLMDAFGELNDGNGPGIEIVKLGFHGMHPPKETAEAFEEVVKAQQERLARLEGAQRVEIRRLAGMAGTVAVAREFSQRLLELEAMGDSPEAAVARLELELDMERAGGFASQLLLDARAERWDGHMTARGSAAEFLGHRAAYAASPELYMTRRALVALREAMADARVFITPADVDLHLRMNLEDQRDTSDVFNSEMAQ
jgi:regulator of protease activity HflC (stomatin/prohibitin superfamily)